jgi:hypothetical protein
VVRIADAGAGKGTVRLGLASEGNVEVEATEVATGNAGLNSSFDEGVSRVRHGLAGPLNNAELDSLRVHRASHGHQGNSRNTNPIHLNLLPVVRAESQSTVNDVSKVHQAARCVNPFLPIPIDSPRFPNLIYTL